MSSLLDALKLIPKPMQIAIAGIVIGIGAVYAHESRYMTVGQFTKSYLLDLKAEIRETKKDLSNPDLPARVREMLQANLEAMLDDLCYELPSDPYCLDRE